MRNKFIFLSLFVLCLKTDYFSQSSNQLELNPEKVKQFSPYLAARHGGPQGLEQFKTANKYTYLRELWYFTESFYVKRNHLAQGVVLNEEIIDITRFEQHRKLDEEAIVVLPGFKDVIVLLPANTLIYKPNYN
jgi:hypothetical protein